MAKRRQAIKAILSENNISRQEFRQKGPAIGDMKKSAAEMDAYKKELSDANKKLDDSKKNLINTTSTLKNTKEGTLSDEDYSKWKNAYDEASNVKNDVEKISLKGNDILAKGEENYNKVKEYAESKGSEKRKSRREYISEYKNKLDSQNKVAGDGSKAAEVVSAPKVANTPISNSNIDWNDQWDKDKTSEDDRAALAWEKQGIKRGPAYSSQRVFPSGETAIYNYDTGRYEIKTTANIEKNPNAYTIPGFETEAPGVALNNAIQSNTAAQTTENAVLKAGIDNAETAGQVFEAPKVAEEAKKEAEKMQTQLDVATVNTVNALSEVTSNLSANQSASQPVENVPVAPAALTAVTGGQAGPIRPSYEQVATKADVAKDVASGYKDLATSIPEAVVEKLGVQDYYPEVGRDIAVGTFTGSRIGSQTVYSGAGGLLPQGLYDARKRALNEAAKAKQTALDKYYSGIDIASQFKPKFNEIVNDAMDNLLYKKHGGNVSAFLADNESRREFSRLEAVAKNVNGYDAYASSVLEDAADDTKYIDPEQVKNAQDIKRALVDDLDGILTGKKDLAPLFAKAQVYQNIIPQVDKVLKEVLDPNRVGRLPINMRTGGVYDEPTFVSERDQFMQKLKGGTLQQAEYISGFKKFFTGNYEQVIDGLIGSTKYSAQQKDAAMNYVAGQLQEQVELENKFVETGNLAAQRLKLDRDKFNYQKQSDKESYFGTINANLNDAVNTQTGKTFNQEIDALKKKGLHGQALNDAIGNVWKQYSYGDVQKNDKGFYAATIPASDMLSKTITSKDIYLNGKPQRTIKVAVHSKGKDGKWRNNVQYMTPSQIGQYSGKKGVVLYSMDEGNTPTKMSPEQVEKYGKSESTVFTKVVSHQIAKGYYDNNNVFHFLNDKNIGAYTSSNRQGTLVRDIEQPYSRSPHTDANQLQVNYVEEMLPGQMYGEWTRIDNQAGQQNKDQQSGYKINQAAEAQGNPDTSSGSGESSGMSVSNPQ